MQEITYENVIQQLLEAVPEFRPDDEDVADKRGALVFEDLTRLVRELVETDGKEEVLGRIFSFIEGASGSSDIRVLDAIRYSFLEGVADSPYHLRLTKKYMGPLTHKLLKDAKRYLKP